MRTRSFLSAMLVAVALSPASAALAKQPAPQGDRAAPLPTAPPEKLPAPPDVSDAMLDAVPPPPHTLSSWDEALKIIDSRDADLKLALLEVERAQGLRREALAPALPQITAQGSVTVQLIRAKEMGFDPASGMLVSKDLPPSPVEQASLTVTQAILAPRVWYAIGTADRQIDLAKLSVNDIRRTLLANVADSIVSVVTAEQVAQIDRVQLKATLARLALQKRKVSLGGGANIDTVRFEQDANAARATLVSGDEQLRQAREKLGIALGSHEAYGVPSNIKLDDIETDATKTCKPGTLQERADIKALYAKKQIDERLVTDVDLEYLPTAQVSSTLLASSEQVVGTGHAQWDVMGVITIPIWDGGARYGAHRVAKVQVEEDTQKIAAAERQGNQQISQAMRGIEVAQRSEKLAEEARDLARENQRLAELAFADGAGTSFDIVDASGKLRQAELNLAVQQLSLTRAKITALLSTATCEY